MKPVIVPEDVHRRRRRRPRLTAAERWAADREAYQQRQAQEHQARVNQVIDEFGGAADAPATMVRMAEEPASAAERWIGGALTSVIIQLQRDFVSNLALQRRFAYCPHGQ